MIKPLAALLGALTLACGCASHSHEHQVAARDNTYGIYGWQSYDNSSKGAGARGMMMDNPYAENSYSAAGAALMVGGPEMETSSKGAGARSMMGETPE